MAPKPEPPDAPSGPSEAPLRILLVEDNPGDALLIRTHLGASRIKPFDLVHVERLSEGLKRLRAEKFDVVLLDLFLPDGLGLDTLVRALVQAPGLPIIVLTGRDDEELAKRAVSSGAQDYLLKGALEADLLSRTVRYAIERQNLQAEWERSRQVEARDREVRHLNRLAGLQAAWEADPGLGEGPLALRARETHDELVETYRGLLDRTGQRHGQEGKDSVSTELRRAGDRLATEGAGPADVVALHRAALGPRLAQVPPEGAAILAEGAGLLLVELLGYLAEAGRTRTPRVPRKRRAEWGP